MPVYLLLIVDNSNSMYTSSINDGSNSYSVFKSWVESEYGSEIFEREPTWCGGGCERWIDEMKLGLEDILGL